MTFIPSNSALTVDLRPSIDVRFADISCGKKGRYFVIIAPNQSGAPRPRISAQRAIIHWRPIGDGAESTLDASLMHMDQRHSTLTTKFIRRLVEPCATKALWRILNTILQVPLLTLRLSALTILRRHLTLPSLFLAAPRNIGAGSRAPKSN